MCVYSKPRGRRDTDIRRRFERSLKHLLADYLPIATRWAIWDNRRLPAKRLVSSAIHGIDDVAQILAHEAHRQE